MSDPVVLVLAAMPRELRPLARALRLRPSSVRSLPAWQGDGVIAVAVGVGPVRAGQGAAKVLEEVPPQRVIVTGVAGALDPSLRVGDLVRPTAVVDMRSGAVHTPTSTATSPAVRAGVLATVERIYLPATGSMDDASSVPLPADATAVDMETAAIAAICEAKGVPWDVVRGISDVVGTLTPEVASLLRPDGQADVAAAARMVLRDPRVLGRLLGLGVDTGRAVRASTAMVVSELAPNRPRPMPLG